MSKIINTTVQSLSDSVHWSDRVGEAKEAIDAGLSREGREIVIVSRHAAAVEWLAAQGITGPVISGNATPEDVAGKVVIGNLPLHLAALAHQVGSIDLPGLRRDQRGGDLSVDEMVAAGAVVRWYAVEAL